MSVTADVSVTVWIFLTGQANTAVRTPARLRWTIPPSCPPSWPPCGSTLLCTGSSSETRLFRYLAPDRCRRSLMSPLLPGKRHGLTPSPALPLAHPVRRSKWRCPEQRQMLQALRRARPLLPVPSTQRESRSCDVQVSASPESLPSNRSGCRGTG